MGNNKLSQLEYDLLELPSTKENVGKIKTAFDNFSNDSNVIQLELLYRGISPRPFGGVENAGARIFFEHYFPILKAAYKNLLKIKEKYEEIDSLFNESKP